jgi:hypothetical protein
VHIVLGFRQLGESEFYREDPLVKRVLGLKSLPSVPTGQTDALGISLSRVPLLSVIVLVLVLALDL